VTKESAGDAMYFISSGAVEADLEPVPQQLGSGDFFGEIALVKNQVRTADVVARSFCELLALYRRDFEELLNTDPEFRATIERVAQERLALLTS